MILFVDALKSVLGIGADELSLWQVLARSGVIREGLFFGALLGAKQPAGS